MAMSGDLWHIKWSWNNHYQIPSSQEITATAQRVREAMFVASEESDTALYWLLSGTGVIPSSPRKFNPEEQHIQDSLLSGTGVTLQWWTDTHSDTERKYQKVQKDILEWLY